MQIAGAVAQGAVDTVLLDPAGGIARVAGGVAGAVGGVASATLGATGGVLGATGGAVAGVMGCRGEPAEQHAAYEGRRVGHPGGVAIKGAAALRSCLQSSRGGAYDYDIELLLSFGWKDLASAGHMALCVRGEPDADGEVPLAPARPPAAAVAGAVRASCSVRPSMLGCPCWVRPPRRCDPTHPVCAHACAPASFNTHVTSGPPPSPRAAASAASGRRSAMSTCTPQTSTRTASTTRGSTRRRR